MAMVHRRLEIVILACRLLPRELLRGWRHFLSVLGSGFLFSGRLRFHPIWTVKAGMAGVRLSTHHRAIDIGVVNDRRIHSGHGSVVTERVSFPVAAPVATAGIAIAIVDPAVQ